MSETKDDDHGAGVVVRDRLSMGLVEVAKVTGLSVNFLRNEAKRGKLKTRKFGRRRLVLFHELQRYLADDSDVAEFVGGVEAGEPKAA
jgi:excisionase family DNA binding protein